MWLKRLKFIGRAVIQSFSIARHLWGAAVIKVSISVVQYITVKASSGANVSNLRWLNQPALTVN